MAMALSAFAQPRLQVSFSGYAGSDCEDEPPTVYLAGSQSDLILEIFNWPHDVAYRGLPTEPAGLVLSATQQITGDSVRTPYPIERLQPRFYVTFNQVLADSAFLQGGEITRNDGRPNYHFLITLPEDLAGKTLCVNAALEDPEFGHLEGFKGVRVVAPCSERDRNQVLASYIMFAHNSRNYRRAIALTDSLLITGWMHANGLANGMMAASALQDYGRSLRYLDLFYDFFGCVPFERERGTARAHELYQTQRAHIEAKLCNQEQHR